MEELYNLSIVSFIVVASLLYCYAIGRIVQKGTARFFCILPILCLFLFLPLNLSSIHFRGITAFFITCLANFKLLLHAFGEGPLCSDDDKDRPSISFRCFLPVACFPIKIEQKSQRSDEDKQNPIPKKNRKKSIPIYAVKGLLLAVLVRVYYYKELIHPNVYSLLYCLQLYLFLELTLAVVATFYRALLGLELEPQFNEPYLSTSLQDFWGRRWNLMVSHMLRSIVYKPVLKRSAPIIGWKWAPLPAIFGTFFVSGIMHELIFYYLGQLRPTWEITLFFLLHGACLVVEVILKNAVAGRWQFPRLVSTLLTMGFVLATGFWLFFPQLLRCQVYVRAFEEYSALSAFLKNADPASMFRSLNTSNNWSIANTIRFRG